MRKKRILIVDDEKDFLNVLDARLSNAGYLVFKATGSERIFERIEEAAPELILLDIMMQGRDGMQVKTDLNRNKSTAGIPVIFLTAKTNISDKIKGLQLGADDYITKPFNNEELLARIESALSRRDFYRGISMTDGLTGLYNVSFYKREIPLFFNIAKRYKKVFSLAMIDIDRFKHINDTYGHAAGDFILKKFSVIAKETFRTADTVIRYGGDEFAVIMPETDYEQASAAIERLKSKINGKVFRFLDIQVELTFSVSAGIATYDDSFTSESRMFELADSRLYEDKGRNRAEARP
ncbi:MAG: hypothetical protein DRP85_07500 [Candidatus Makaraimicrobium thalassicum]|nr:MAG: hypothetical protein DRP85_07500 [Candidatus Omnitrophota bacterium]